MGDLGGHRGLGRSPVRRLHGTTLDEDVDNVIFDDFYIGLACTARLWGSKLASGLVIEAEPAAPAKIFAAIKAAAVRAGPAAMTIHLADMEPTEARPGPPAPPV